MALHISSSEKRPFDPSWTCLCIVHLTVKGHSACTAASQSPLYPKCQSAHCKTHVAMRQQRPDPSMGTTESSHGWLEVTEPKERQTQINSSVQRALIQQAISLFALKMTIQNRKPPYRETFTFGTVPCAKHFLCELDLFPPLQTQMRCLHHHLLPLTQWSSTKTYFLLNQTFFFFFLSCVALGQGTLFLLLLKRRQCCLKGLLTRYLWHFQSYPEETTPFVGRRKLIWGLLLLLFLDIWHFCGAAFANSFPNTFKTDHTVSLKDRKFAISHLLNSNKYLRVSQMSEAEQRRPTGHP